METQPEAFQDTQAVADPIFPSPDFGAKTYHFEGFAENCIIMKEIGPPMIRIPCAPPKSATN